MLRDDRKTLKCCEQSWIQLNINDTEPVHIEALVIDRRLLGFNLILGNVAIKVAGGVTNVPAGVVSFAGKKATVCTAIHLDMSDFCTEFNQMQNC